MISVYTDRKSQPQNDCDRYSKKLITRKERKKMYTRNGGKNPAPWTPTFYGKDRKERLEEHLTKVSADCLPFSHVGNGQPETEESED